MSENYGEVRDVLEKSNPEGMEKIRAYVRKASKSLDLNPQELDETIRLFKYIIDNQRNYAEIKARLQREFDAKLPERFDPVYFGMGLVVLQVMQSGSNFAQGGIAQLAQELQSKGRYGDTILAHISPEEANLLKSLGGSGTINPDTGLPEFFLKWVARKLGDAVESVGNIVGDIVEGVGDIVEDIVESPVGRVIATAALTAVGAPYLAGFGISTAGTAAIVSGGLTAATGGDLGDIAKSAALAFAGSELMQSVSGPDVKWMDQVSPSQLEAIGTGILPGDFSWMDAVTPSQLAAAGVSEFVPQLTESLFDGYDFSQPLSAPSMVGEFVGPVAPQGVEALPRVEEFLGMETPLVAEVPAGPEWDMGYPSTPEVPLGTLAPAVPSIFEPSVDDLLGSSNVSWDNYGDLSSLETPLSAETPSLPEFSPEDMVPPSALPQPTELPQFSPEDMVPPSALPQPQVLGDPTAGFGGMPVVPPMTPAEVAAAAASQGLGDPALAAEMGTADLSWMDKVSPSQMAAIDTGTLPGTTFLDKAAYAIGAAGEKLADKLTTPAGLASAAYGIASLADLSKSGSGGGGGGGGGWSGVMPRYTLERSVIPSAFERKPYERTEIINPDNTKTYTPTPVMGRAFFTAPKYVPRATATTTGTTSEATMPNTQPQDEPSVVTAAQGGIMALNKGRYLRGRTDGMADKIPSNIDGVQPAALSHGEFVIPADVVSHLGNGNSEAGADVLYKMMDRVRKARTGTSKQGKQINPSQYVPGGIVQLNNGGSVGTTSTSSSLTGPITTSTSSSLSPWAAPTVTESLARAEALAFEPYQSYEGQLVATTSPVQQEAFTTAKGLTAPSRKWSESLAKTYMNPYLSMVQKPVIAELERQADIRQQNIQSQFTRAGAFGGARDVIARMENERNLQDAKAKVLGETTAQAYDKGLQVYGAERTQDVRDLEAMLRAGEMERGIESEEVKALQTQFEKEQTAPLERLSQYIGLLRGLPIATSTASPILSDLQKLGLTVAQTGKLYDLLSNLGGESLDKKKTN